MYFSFSVIFRFLAIFQVLQCRNHGGEAGNEDGNADTQGSNKPAYIVDPDTGELIDAVTGEKAQMDYNMDGDDAASGAETGDGTENKGNT